MEIEGIPIQVRRNGVKVAAAKVTAYIAVLRH